MLNKKEIAKGIFYVGVNDRQKQLFENYIPIPQGVSYNSYLIIDEKITLIDTVDVSMFGTYITKLETLLNGKSIDYLVVNHMEPDHAGSVGLLCERFPNMIVVGNPKTFTMIDGYFDLKNQRLTVNEGDSISLGDRKLTFYTTPMVHWPEVMVAYEDKDKILFSADAFGTFGTLDGSFLDSDLNTERYWSEMRRYYACIVGKFGKATQNAINKLSTLSINTICSTHGPVWRRDIQQAITLYDKWSKYETEEGVVIAYGTMYGNTQQLAEAFAEGVVDGGVSNVVIHNVSTTDASYILADIFKYKGIAIGSPTYMNEIYPNIESLLKKIEHRGIPNHIYACFGSRTWAGGSVKILNEFGQRMKWEIVSAPIDNLQGIKNSDYQAAYQQGLAMAKQLIAVR